MRTVWRDARRGGIKLLPSSGLEATYTIGEDPKVYQVNDISSVFYQELIENDYILPITLNVLEGRGQNTTLSWLITDPGGREFTLKKDFLP